MQAPKGDILDFFWDTFVELEVVAANRSAVLSRKL
jgi:hypothetical protein